jgi:hypothetical protein
MHAGKIRSHKRNSDSIEARVRRYGVPKAAESYKKFIQR